MSKQIDYTSKDYAGFVEAMKESIPDYLPEWTSRSASDPGMVLIEAFAYVADILSFYGDRIANEAFLQTATQRRSVLDIAKTFDYTPRGNLAATADVIFTTASGVGTVVIPKHTRILTSSEEAAAAGQDPVYFTTDADLPIDTSTVTTGSVSATQGEIVSDEVLGVSSGRAGQEFTLFRTPVVDGDVQVFVDDGGGPVAWTLYSHLLDASGDDLAFSLFTDEDDVVHITLGDDVNGRIPTLGATITATYRVGGGTRGNVGAGAIKEIASAISGVTAVTNAAAADGGADRESVADIKKNVPRSLRAINRAVTLSDYADLALASGYVGRAKATASVYTSVNLYIGPKSGGGNVVPSLKTDLSLYMADRILIGTDLTFLDPTYVGVDIEVTVAIYDSYKQNAVSLALKSALTDLLLYENVDFGDRIRLGDVHRVLSTHDAVISHTVTTLARAGGAGAADVQMADYEIPKPGNITVTVNGGIV